MKDKIKNQKGITLIALIVTIIVLIILAAVGISMLLGENGITEKARWSEFVTEYEKMDEQKNLYITEQHINEYGYTDRIDYPIIQGEKVEIGSVSRTLRSTIRGLERVSASGLRNKNKVNLYKVDLSLLETKETKREYVINIASGMLYSLDQVPYQGKVYHTPKYAVGGDAEESEYVIHYLPENGKEEVIRNIPNGNNKIQLEKRENLGITQEGKFFLHWKDVTDEHKEDDEDEEEEETTGNEGKTYEDGDEIDLETDRWLQNRNIYLKAVWQDGVILNANGGTIIEEGKEIKTKTIRVTEGQPYGEELNKEPTRTGYTFTGWYTEKEEGRGIEKTSEHEYHASDLTNSTLYAHWVDDIKPETFTISVDDLTSEGFTMNLSQIEDFGSGVNEEDGVKYYVSDEIPTLDTVNASSQLENTVTGLTKDMTKYVWAEITDYATNTRKSTNYVEVWTGHDHTDFEGSCFSTIPVLHSLESFGQSNGKETMMTVPCSCRSSGRAFSQSCSYWQGTNTYSEETGEGENRRKVTRELRHFGDDQSFRGWGHVVTDNQTTPQQQGTVKYYRCSSCQKNWFDYASGGTDYKWWKCLHNTRRFELFEENHGLV